VWWLDDLLGLCRSAWGVKKDPIAARQYYETAANLGDTDALEEAAWCYLEGFGGPKDKVSLGPQRSLFVLFAGTPSSALIVRIEVPFPPISSKQKHKRERLTRSTQQVS